MKALVKTTPGPGAVLQQIPVPVPGPTDLLVKVKATALCKSDLDVIEWSPLVASSNLPLPLIMGHEFFGEVCEVGKMVKNFKAGDYITGETHIPCGYCHSCRTGNRHICSNNMGVVGRSIDGSFAEYICLPEVSAIKLDKSMPPAEGALMEPLATALHALSKAQVAGETVLVLGCGAIGLMTVELAKVFGATNIFALDIFQHKLEAARKCGAEVVINGREEDLVEVVLDATKGLGVGTVIETTGNQEVINKAVNALRVAGTLVFVGMIDHPLTFEEFMHKVVYRELTLTGIFGRKLYETWETLQMILDSGKLDLSRYVGAEIKLDEFEKGLELFPTTLGRVIMYP
ncbi:MAG TPA: alcohol dehydrogenase catalytic domain-containing protein [Firmicutes bacterium]|nr:alcohol dehydrogenase catalytic domain-containing protein [Bacillota bacterium]